MLADCEIVQLLWKIVQGFLQKLRTRLLQPVAIILKVNGTECWGDICTPMFKVVLACTFKNWQHQVAINDEYRNKHGTHTAHYPPALQNTGEFCCNLQYDETGGGFISELSHTQEDKHLGTLYTSVNLKQWFKQKQELWKKEVGIWFPNGRRVL